MFDAKKLLDQFLGSQVPGAGGSVRDRAGQVTQLAKDNPLASIAIAGVLLGTGTGREVAGSALRSAASRRSPASAIRPTRITRRVRHPTRARRRLPNCCRRRLIPASRPRP